MVTPLLHHWRRWWRRQPHAFRKMSTEATVINDRQSLPITNAWFSMTSINQHFCLRSQSGNYDRLVQRRCCFSFTAASNNNADRKQNKKEQLATAEKCRFADSETDKLLIFVLLLFILPCICAVEYLDAYVYSSAVDRAYFAFMNFCVCLCLSCIIKYICK